MIGSFWNLCRACPSMPVDKLHSEYRSTYRWHDYKKTVPLPGGVVRQQAPPPPLNPLPQAREQEPAMPRRKKYPGLAYKSNEFFDPSLVAATEPHAIKFKTAATAAAGVATLDRARSVERNGFGRAGGAGRRSKSEGRQRQPPAATDAIDAKVVPVQDKKEDPMTFSSEYRNQFVAWSKDAADTAAQPRKSISMGTLKIAAQQSIKRKQGGVEAAPEAEPLMNHIDENAVDNKVREEKMMNGHVPRRSAFRSALTAFINVTNGKDNRKCYKSEYKKKFRPFSHYVYEASKGKFTKCRGNKLDEADGSNERMLPETKPEIKPEVKPETQEVEKSEVNGVPGESWYKEVLDLRKRAGEYKYRGWGTELAPEHITQLYNKQIELWYQVSRRSSLSALSLASTHPRALGKDDRILDKNCSPKKLKSFRAAPHQSIHAKIQEQKASDRSPHKTSPQKFVRKQQRSFDDGAHEINEQRRPRSADPRPVSRQPLHKSGTKQKAVTQSKSTVKPKIGSAQKKVIQQNGTVNRRSRSASNVGIKLEEAPPPRFDTPLVKSPPEPTRVKSPEQLNMRSPDPVNWTVPLDTARTFTVTQNVKTEIAPTHQLSPKRTLKLNKSESPTPNTRSTAKTPTATPTLTPIDETKALTTDLSITELSKPIANGHVKEGPAIIKAEAKSDGTVDTSIVLTDSQRSGFGMFWGKKDENNEV